jgi:hypothetical protein
MADYIEFELNGQLFRVNREDSYDLYRWCVKGGRGMLKNPYWRKVSLSNYTGGYLCCTIGNRKYLHHRIVYYAHNPDWDINDTSNNNHIDHIDGDRLNNQITNLRVVTQAENNQNINAKGVGYKKANKKWQSQIQVNHKQIYLGLFDTEEEALQARAEAVKKYHPYNMRQS